MPGGTQHCAMSHHVPFLFSEPRMERCCSQEWVLCLWCQCFHVQSNCLGKHLPQCFHESALKVHMVHCHSLPTLAPVCCLCMVCNLIAMCHEWLRVWSDVICLALTPCRFALTLHNLCSPLRAVEWLQCSMHIVCFHIVVTPLARINQEWWMLEHQVSVVEQLVHMLWRCWL